jgi:hypothetical protein
MILTNLLVNPSFEQGVKPWHYADYTTSKWSSVRGDAEDGCKYLYVLADYFHLPAAVETREADVEDQENCPGIEPRLVPVGSGAKCQLN